MRHTLYPNLQKRIQEFETQFREILTERKTILQQLTDFIQQKQKLHAAADLNFICTHNSRRSHIAQLWAHAAAAFYGIENVHCFSGGTEATAFNSRAVKAMQDSGFIITKAKEGENPIYEVRYADGAEPVIAFSKTYDDPFNHTKGFAAIMTCSHADENCPMVIGIETRISLPYHDPKDFDGTELEQVKYHERVLEIGREICFAFSIV